MRRAGSLTALLSLTAVIAACGEKTINADNAAETVANLVAEETGFEPTDVECPEDVSAEEGETFKCTFTGPEGPYDADVEITEVEGEDAIFDINTHPVSQGG